MLIIFEFWIKFNVLYFTRSKFHIAYNSYKLSSFATAYSQSLTVHFLKAAGLDLIS